MSIKLLTTGSEVTHTFKIPTICLYDFSSNPLTLIYLYINIGIKIHGDVGIIKVLTVSWVSVTLNDKIMNVNTQKLVKVPMDKPT